MREVSDTESVAAVKKGRGDCDGWNRRVAIKAPCIRKCALRLSWEWHDYPPFFPVDLDEGGDV